MLDNLRVLDLTDEVGLMCGQLLADMGADVQQWVRPEHSMKLQSDAHWQAYTLGKGVQLIDWAVELDRLFGALAVADVLIESETEAFWTDLGLPENTFTERFPELIRVNVGYFGRLGPKAHYAATDLTSLAASGHLSVSGCADAAPLRISVPQAHAHASSDAAVAVLIALFDRARSGLGQTVDISAQQSTSFALLSRGLDGLVGQPKAERSAYGAQIGGVYLRNQFDALDGPVVILQGILPPLAGFMERLMRWVHEAGFIAAQHLEQDWGQAAMGLASGTLTEADWAPVQDGIAALVAGLSKAQLMTQAVSRRLLIAPVFTLAEVLECEQLKHRDTVRVRPGKPARLGPFARLSGSPLPLTESAAHDWSGRSQFDAVEAARADSGLPLTGLKVLDVFWVVAGPGATRMLADYGATVVHVESSRRPDMVRNVPPYIEGIADPERAACHHSTNANKLNIAVDLSTEEGRAVLSDLIRWADVFTESFAPGVIERMGFGYQAVQALNPDIIMISSSLMGQSGPWSGYAGYGNSAAAVTGFHGLTGTDNAAPTGCFGPYTDFTSVRFNALAILGAVLHLLRTGEGQFIDMAQAEAALHFLAPACFEYLNAGRLPEPRGNRDAQMVPHGVYPVLGTDRWIAISIRDDADWARFAGLLGRPDLVPLDRSARREREDELDGLICDWTAVREGRELEAGLQDLAIPAHRVLDTEELANDPELLAREHFLRVTHKTFTESAVESSRLRFSRIQARRPEQAPWFGIDTGYVLTELLGYGSDILRRLEERKVLR